ncbi:MAG: leucine-rich repeat domain-containing protein [Candidatus Aminicenantes bacterium]|nr:MAG: leucine-rich repeat domain-containing protein [Candidatus Aminicenantes bacterium]
MASDLELIKELEKDIGIELKQLEYENIWLHKNNGIFINKSVYVKGLNLDGIQLITLPLSKFQHLETLSLYNTGITDYSFLQRLRTLTHLDLSNNQIADISFLHYLCNLTHLDLSENQITDISCLHGLSNLTSLNLNSNKIADISCLQGLSNLTVLDLSSNRITDVSFLQDLKNLTILDLTENKIIKLPETIVELGMKIDVDSKYAGKRGIFLYGNPIESPPIEILNMGIEAIRVYFKSLEGKIRALNEVKVLLVGDGGSGKTSLVKRLFGQAIDKNEPQTHGINVNHKWEVTSDKVIKIHFWDFGGQEIMHATHQFFLSKRSLYILVLDGRRDEKTEYWLKHIQSFGGDSPVLVVLNKIDENPVFDVNRPFLQEKYKNIKGFFRVSCATDEGIKTFSQHLINELGKVELIHITWGYNWFNVKIQLEKITKDFISYDEYKTICKKEKITDKISQDTLVDYLNDLGVVLHFKDFKLEETHVLDPEWVTTAVYKIINSEKIGDTQGVLKLSLLEDILKKREVSKYYYPREKYSYIIDLMKKFELCYGIDDETVLIPDLLIVQEPTFDFDYFSALKFIIQYDFLPRSVMPRFIVNMHKDVKNNLQWRTGVVLEDKDFESTAVIKADNEAKRIYIYVKGVQKRDYFAAILATLRRINRSFEKLKTTELIAMPDDPDITVSYKHLIRLEKEEIEFYFPGESEKKYRVKDLLGSIGGEIEEDETLQMLKQIKIAQMQRKAGKKE